MNKKFYLLPLCLVLFSLSGVAQSAKFLIEGGVEYGGDEIITVFFTNGGDQSLKAGQGAYIAVGGQFQFSAISKLLLRTTVGIKYNTTAADNANIRFTRVPINLIGYWKITEAVRLGAGITLHQNVRFKGDGFVPDIDFQSSVGQRVELGYKWIAATYTVLDYKDELGQEVSASSFGFSLSFTLPK